MNSTNISVVRPMTGEQAARAVRRITSCYPSINPIALREYLGELAILLSTYSEGVATAGLEAAMRVSPNYPPPVPLVQNHCDELIASSRSAFEFARTWEEGARQQLIERAAIEQELAAEPLAHRRAVVARVMDELRAVRTPEPTPAARDPWKRLGDDELRARYPKQESV